jgi:hypothetical protein
VFIKDPLENSMVSFNFIVTLEEGVTFIFGSWICVADGAGGFRRHLATTMKPKASASTPHRPIDALINDLGEIQLYDPKEDNEHESRSCPMLVFLTSQINPQAHGIPL